jgi:hypothetical protein
MALRSASSRQHAHALAAGAVVLELDEPVREREESVIPAQAHVPAGPPLRTVLANDDRPAANTLPTEPLDA